MTGRMDEKTARAVAEAERVAASLREHYAETGDPYGVTPPVTEPVMSEETRASLRKVRALVPRADRHLLIEVVTSAFRDGQRGQGEDFEAAAVELVGVVLTVAIEELLAVGALRADEALIEAARQRIEARLAEMAAKLEAGAAGRGA